MTKVADLSPGTQVVPKFADAGVAVEFGEKKQGSQSIKGAMTISLDSKVKEPVPDKDGKVPAHGEIEFKADSQAQAEKLLENIEQMINYFGKSMKEVLPQLTVEGSSLKLIDTLPMEYDAEAYKKIQEGMQA